jgi:hypothetical protein
MSNILCVMIGGLSGCTHIYVIVLQHSVLNGGDKACFALSMYYYTFFTNMSTTFLFLSSKNSERYNPKIIGSSSKLRDSSSGYKQTNLIFSINFAKSTQFKI